MIIDANVHITKNGKWFNTDHDASVTDLLTQMEKAGISKSILVPFEGIMSNEFIQNIAKQYPGKFIPAASFNPAKYNDVDEVRNAFIKEFDDDHSAGIIKFHNRLHKYDIEDERLLAALETNNRLANPKIIFICGLFFSNKTKVTTAPPVIVHQLAMKLTNTTIVLMHCCGSWCLQVAEVIRDFPNIYMDLSFVISKYKESSLWLDLKHLVINFDQRLIWGSDFPEISIQQSLKDLNELTRHLPAQKIENIRYLNISKILQVYGR